ncbi:MAG: DnaJ domain-containing protein [Acidimicrobiales bacterium]
MSRNTLYEVLEVDPSASIDSIRTSYRALSKEHHPDAGGSRERFERLSEAHQVLSNPRQRRAYDEDLLRDAARDRAVLTTATPPNRQIVVEASSFDEPLWHSAARLLGVLIITGVFLAIVVVPGLLIWWRLDGTPDLVDARPRTRSSETASEAAQPHNGLPTESTALRWLVAYQALTGVSPQISPEESRQVYAASDPGALCEAFATPQYWSGVGLESDDIEVVSDAVNRDLARAVAECDNMETIVPALGVSLQIDTALLSSRLARIERFADEVAFTPSVK